MNKSFTTLEEWLKHYSHDFVDFQFRLEYWEGKPLIHISTEQGDCQSMTFEVNGNNLVPKNFL